MNRGKRPAQASSPTLPVAARGASRTTIRRWLVTRCATASRGRERRREDGDHEKEGSNKGSEAPRSACHHAASEVSRDARASAGGHTAPPRSCSSSHSASATFDPENAAISRFAQANFRPDTRVAPNVLFHELTLSELADCRGIPDDFPSDQGLRAATHLACEALQRDHYKFGRLAPDSVFRGHPLASAPKDKLSTWLSTSQHARGEACKIETVAKPTQEMANWGRDHLPDFDQIICECYDPDEGPNSGWKHVSLKVPGSGANRRQCLSYVADPASGRLVYVRGLTATT